MIPSFARNMIKEIMDSVYEKLSKQYSSNKTNQRKKDSKVQKRKTRKTLEKVMVSTLMIQI